jgi:hypothetical protein
MLILMKYRLKGTVLTFLMALALCGGCQSLQKETAHPRSEARGLPQLARFIRVTNVQTKPGMLIISGAGSAAADNGKNTFTAKSPISAYPLIRMTIKIDKADDLDFCTQHVQSARDNHQSIDIRGTGTFRIESIIDPPLETGLFTLTELDTCGNDPASAPVSRGVVSSGTVVAADLVAVPERYLDRSTVITGHLAAPVHFMDPVSRVDMESEGQTLSGYFLTPSLKAESRLALVHAAQGSHLVLKGIWTHVSPKSLAAQAGTTASSGYEFDISDVLSIEPGSALK